MGLSLQDLADRLGQLDVKLSRAALSNYETNKSSPSAKNLWGIAKILNASMDYFVAAEERSIVLQGFRKKADTPASRVNQLRALIEDEIEKRMDLDAVLGEEEPRDLPTQKKIDSVAQAEEIARDIRSAWGLGDQPISSVSSTLEAKGWYVLEVPYDDGFDGLAGFIESNHRPFAVSRTGIAVDRVRLNLLHEAGHAFVAGDDDKASEKAAFRFAAAFLLPRERAIEDLGRKRSSVDMEELLFAKKRYGLSMQAIAYRLKDLEIISESYMVLLFRYFTSMGMRVEEPGSRELMFEEKPMAFASKVHRAFAEGLITEDDAVRLLPGFRETRSSPDRLSSSEIKRILSLPGEERNRILEASAAAAEGVYSDPDVNIAGLADDIIEYS
jgi:Zn-dependent peptidase ImmA (M78 family)